MANSGNLNRSTHAADTAREACTCVQRCPGCHHDGTWHTHVDDACALHPQAPVE